MPRRFSERRAIARGVSDLGRKPFPLELKADIGHYGGYYVWVPKQKVSEFHGLFGSSFPRGESKHLSRPELPAFKFANRTKGEHRLNELQEKGLLKLKFPDYDD